MRRYGARIRLSDLRDREDADESTHCRIVSCTCATPLCDFESSDALRSVKSTVLVSGDGARVVNDAGRRASLIREFASLLTCGCAFECHFDAC